DLDVVGTVPVDEFLSAHTCGEIGGDLTVSGGRGEHLRRQRTEAPIIEGGGKHQHLTGPRWRDATSRPANAHQRRWPTPTPRASWRDGARSNQRRRRCVG